MNEVDDEEAFSAMLRHDFLFFLRKAFLELGGRELFSHNWHIDAIAYELDRIRTGKNKRLIVTMPPRHLKSRTISIAWIAWCMGHDPEISFLCPTYGQGLSDDHARDCLQIMESSWYRRAFPRLTLTRRAVEDIRTSAGGRRMATSIDGATTGFGADVIVIDDPMKGQDVRSEGARAKVIEWFDGTLRHRLTNQMSGAIVIVMQRLHEGDLVGELIERGGWHELRLPSIATRDEDIPLTGGRVYRRREGHALHPARLSLAALLELQAANPYVFSSQHQQEPVPAVGNIIEASWIQQFDLASLDRTHGQVVMSIDTASRDNPFNDYSAFVVALVQERQIYVIDVFRARLRFHELEAKTIELARLHGVKDLLIEEASSGQQLIDRLRAEAPAGVPFPIPRRPEVDKIARALGVSAMIQSGRFFLPGRAHWLGDYASELLGFPSSRYDDQVDATTQLLSWVQQNDMYRPLPDGQPELYCPDDPDYNSRKVENPYHHDPNYDPWGP